MLNKKILVVWTLTLSACVAVAPSAMADGKGRSRVAPRSEYRGSRQDDMRSNRNRRRAERQATGRRASARRGAVPRYDARRGNDNYGGYRDQPDTQYDPGYNYDPGYDQGYDYDNGYDNGADYDDRYDDRANNRDDIGAILGGVLGGGGGIGNVLGGGGIGDVLGGALGNRRNTGVKENVIGAVLGSVLR